MEAASPGPVPSSDGKGKKNKLKRKLDATPQEEEQASEAGPKAKVGLKRAKMCVRSGAIPETGGHGLWGSPSSTENKDVS